MINYLQTSICKNFLDVLEQESEQHVFGLKIEGR